MLRRVGLPLVVLAALVVPAEASAVEWKIKSEHEPETRRLHLDVGFQGYFSTRVGLVPGLIFGIPVAPTGFISALNDAFFVEAVLFSGVYLSPTVFWLTPAAGVRWAFYLTDEWAVFAALRLGWSVTFDDLDRAFRGFYFSGTLGAHWHFAEDFALRLETGGARFGYRVFVGISWQLPVEL